MRRKIQIQNARKRRHRRIRNKISGTATRPRLCVFRSSKHVYTQLIDDVQGQTLLGVSTLSSEIKSVAANGGNIAAAKEVGKLVAKKALEKNITEVVFDRNGYKYHGRVAALADEARKNGLKF